MEIMDHYQSGDGGSYSRNQNYQNPFDLLHDNGFVSALLLLLFITFLEIVVGVLYSTYCSYPQLMRSEKNRRRAQYCVTAGCQTNAEGPLRMDMSDILFSDSKNSDDNHPIKVSPGYSSRGHSVDIQSLISTFLEEEKDTEGNNEQSFSHKSIPHTRSDDSIYVTADTIEDNNQEVKKDDLLKKMINDKISEKFLKGVQHTRGLTEGNPNPNRFSSSLIITFLHIS
jgi:hypothetical protein